MVVTERLTVRTYGNNHVVDLTEQVAEAVTRSGLKAGIVTVFVPGSTAGLTTMEFESGAVEDLQHWLEEAIPASREYRHNLRWGDQNGHSHLRASLIGPSLTIPFQDHRLLLGTWQQIVLIDFDIRPRRREIIIQMIGE
ncbi:secondary thiamine-phosphate synthase enzyme YjbQ [Thermoflexus sp.]|uniref:secondary thiamine-phosphate synthase enzyme YjbQ n=1 Tax=Thermoflexus sp. TaxID=1969742 RepID=UPI0035E424D6